MTSARALSVSTEPVFLPLSISEIRFWWIPDSLERAVLDALKPRYCIVLRERVLCDFLHACPDRTALMLRHADQSFRRFFLI